MHYKMVFSGTPHSKANRSRRRAALSLLLCLLAPSVWGSDIPEYKLKAAYLYNFASFTTWPAEYAHFELCIFGEDPFGKHLKQITARKVKGNVVTARTVKTVDGLSGCQLVFIAPSAHNRTNQVLNQVSHQPVLTVSDGVGGLDNGVMINMATHRGKVRFDVNLELAKQHDLKISSKLLRLAREVIR